MRANIIKSSLRFCTIVHLVIFFVAVAWYMESGSIACIFDQLTETFEFMFSPLPVENSDMLSNPAATVIEMQLIAIYFFTAIPGYAIGYLLLSRYFNKQAINPY